MPSWLRILPESGRGEQSESPGYGWGLLIEKNRGLHCRDEVGKDACRVVLQEFRHAGGHSGIHRGRAEGINANAFAGLRETVLGQAHQNANPDLHRIASQGLDDKLIYIGIIAGGEVRHFKHDARILIHDPKTVGAFHALPGVFRGSVDAFLPEEVIAQFPSAPINTKASEERIPGFIVSAPQSGSSMPEVDCHGRKGKKLKQRQYHR